MKTEQNLKKGIILLSGGLDSATVLAIAKSEGYLCHALSIRYGQKNVRELKAAKQIVMSFGVESHVIFDFNLSLFGGSALTSDLDVPKSRSQEAMNKEIPITYVPARNTVFLSLALAFAESIDAQTIFIGVNALDYSGYPDCRFEFIKAFEAAANLGTKAGIEGQPFTIQTPLIHLTKAQIIQKGIELGVDYSITWSCYDPAPNGRSCGQCDSCILRKKGFKEANFKDPTKYADI